MEVNGQLHTPAALPSVPTGYEAECVPVTILTELPIIQLWRQQNPTHHWAFYAAP